MIKVAGIGLVVTLLCLILKKDRPEFVFALALAGCLTLLFLGLSKLSLVMETLQKLEDYLGVNASFLTILLKMVGIAYLAELASSLCKDAGQGAMAGQIDMVGKVSMLLLSLPVLQSLIQTLGEYMP